MLALPAGESSPPGYGLYKRSDRNGSLEWEEKAPVSIGRYTGDGLVELDGKIYFVGGYNSSGPVRTFERFDPITNQWDSMPYLQDAREGLASAVLDGKIYAIGGVGFSSMEIFDPQTNQWSYGANLPKEIDRACAVSLDGKIILTGGRVDGVDQTSVYEFDPDRGTWESLDSLQYARSGHRMVQSGGRIWVLGGNPTICESYDLNTDSWRVETSLNVARSWAVAWATAGGDIYMGGGNSPGSDSIEYLAKGSSQWVSINQKLPARRYGADAIVFQEKVFVVSGKYSGSFSTKVYAADIAPPMDLYYREANASGTITLDKLSADLETKLVNSQPISPPAGLVTAVAYHDNPPSEHTYSNSPTATQPTSGKSWPQCKARYAYDGSSPLVVRYISEAVNDYAQIVECTIRSLTPGRRLLQ